MIDECIAADREHLLRRFTQHGYPAATVDCSQVPATAPAQAQGDVRSMDIVFTVNLGAPRVVLDFVAQDGKHAGNLVAGEKIEKVDFPEEVRPQPIKKNVQELKPPEKNGKARPVKPPKPPNTDDAF